MATTAQHRRPNQLVLLPLRTDAPEGAIEAIERLQVAGALEVGHAASVECGHDGTMTAIDVVRPGEPPLDSDGWRELLATVVGCGAPEAGRPRPAGVSPSFAAEVRALLRGPGRWLAALSCRVEPSAAVDELADVPHIRMVYGVLPGALTPR